MSEWYETMSLRFVLEYVSDDRKQRVLQQLWRKHDSTEEEWRNVPMVEE